VKFTLVMFKALNFLHIYTCCSRTAFAGSTCGNPL